MIYKSFKIFTTVLTILLITSCSKIKVSTPTTMSQTPTPSTQLEETIQNNLSTSPSRDVISEQASKTIYNNIYVDFSKLSKEEVDATENFIKSSEIKKEDIREVITDKGTGNISIKLGGNEDSVFYLIGADNHCYKYSDHINFEYIGLLNCGSKLNFNAKYLIANDDFAMVEGTYLKKEYVDAVNKSKSTIKYDSIVRTDYESPLLFSIEEKDRKYISGTFDFHQGGYGGNLIYIVRNKNKTFSVGYRSSNGIVNITIKSVDTDIWSKDSDKKNVQYFKSKDYHWGKLADAILIQIFLGGKWIDGQGKSWIFNDNKLDYDGNISEISIGIDNGNPRDCEYIVINKNIYAFELKGDELIFYEIDKSKDYGTFKSGTIHNKLKKIN